MFPNEMVSGLVLVSCFGGTLEIVLLLLFGFLVVPLLHFNGKISALILPDEFDRLAVLVFHFEVA